MDYPLKNGVKMTDNQTQQIRFIKKQLTPENPIDIYYINYEETIKTYFLLILIGLFMVAYLVFY